MFEHFWQTYPRKVSKGAALKSWTKLNPDTHLAEQIVKAVESQKAYRQRVQKANELLPKWKQKFMPDWKHPATWLNQQCWLDEVPDLTTKEEQPKKRNNECTDCNGEFQYLYKIEDVLCCIRCYEKRRAKYEQQMLRA